jgi:large subunit ribosomal protein L21
MDAIDGSPVEIDRVLLVSDGESVTNGNPVVEGARVLATSQGDFKGEKTICFKYKNKTRYHRKIGHRQMYTRLAIDQIVVGSTPAKPKTAGQALEEVSDNGA